MRANKKLLAVIDTNVLLVSISSRSKFHWIYEAILSGVFELAITPDIMLEYEEKISEHWSASVASNVVRSITELSTTVMISVYYNLNLISSDEDDNKFVDCAFAANADLIVTHDNHFNILKRVDFPRIPVVDVPEFKRRLT
ncbi:hypothetical protein GCM10023231_34120 [Olivibacter ginsenosidimutans]|uniref:PIN domain-containing protein n=1 Tax=Olivibacter ginsenosidimutans TaxID=1176537 RepID=A0ABP9C329_9SPHI